MLIRLFRETTDGSHPTSHPIESSKKHVHCFIMLAATQTRLTCDAQHCVQHLSNSYISTVSTPRVFPVTRWISKKKNPKRVNVIQRSIFIVVSNHAVTSDPINPTLRRHLLAAKIGRIHFGEVRSELGQGLRLRK